MKHYKLTTVLTDVPGVTVIQNEKYPMDRWCCRIRWRTKVETEIQSERHLWSLF